jgi:hypothetical protein
MDQDEYEDRLGDALEKLMGAGADDLEALSARLNALGIAMPGGASWTSEALAAELTRLAA